MTNNWQVATLVSSRDIAQGVKSLTFKVDDWIKHQSGQHYNIRLTAEDGYQAERDYSIASAPEQEGLVEFGVERLEDGEVSPYLHTLQPGEQIEIRGPIGGHFVWHASMMGPLLLVGGGSGVVPLMSILRHYINNQDQDETRSIVFLISAKTETHILYYKELKEYAERHNNIQLALTLTRQTPPHWQGFSRRVDKDMLMHTLYKYKDAMPKTFVCGPTEFVETVAQNLTELGFYSHEILTERFG